MSSLSAELLRTLTDLRASYPALIEESQSLRARLEELSLRLTSLSSESENWEAESKELSASLRSLTQEFEDYRAATRKRAELDAKAIDEARGAALWWAVGGASAGFVVGWLVHW